MTESPDIYNKVYKLGADHCFYFDSLVVDRLTIAIEKCHREDQRWFQRNSNAFQGCSRRINIESNSNSTLLLSGPQGVGKSAIARVIHDSSPSPFRTIRCG